MEFESETGNVPDLSPFPLERTNTRNISECYPLFCEGEVPVSPWNKTAAAADSSSQHQAEGCTPSLHGITFPSCSTSSWRPIESCQPGESLIPSASELRDFWKFITTGDLSLSAMTVYSTTTKSSASTNDPSLPLHAAAAAKGLQQDDATDSSSITTESGIQAQISSIGIPNPHSTPLLIEVPDNHKALNGDQAADSVTENVPHDPLSSSLNTENHWDQALSKLRLLEEEDFVQRMKREFRRRREEKKNKDNRESEKDALRNRIKGTLYKLRTRGMSIKAMETKRQILQEQEQKKKSQLNDVSVETPSTSNESKSQSDEEEYQAELDHPLVSRKESSITTDTLVELVSEKESTTTDTVVEQDYDADASGFITPDVENGTANSGDDEITGAFEVSAKKSVRFAEDVQEVRTLSSSVDSVFSSMEGRQPSEVDSAASDSTRADNSEADSSKWWLDDGYNRRDAVGVTSSTWDMDSVDTEEWMLEEKPLLGLGRPESLRSKALRKSQRKARRKSMSPSPSPQVQQMQQKLQQLNCAASKAHQRLS